MKKTVFAVLPVLVTFFVFVASAGPLQAEDKIQAFVNPSGKIVFTNLNEINEPVVPGMTGAPSGGVLTLLRDEMPENLRPLVESISTNHGVDPNLVSAVIKAESNFNRWAVSPKGARGLMQLIPATAARFGVRDSFDPQQNIEGGVRYLKFLLAKFDGNVELALAGYNAGENVVERLGRIPAYTETRNYVRKISAMYKPYSGAQAVTAAAAASAAPIAQTAAAAPSPQTQQIFRTIDKRGVIQFSNIGPMN